ncbi:hypothetical protein BvCmsKSP055_03381 [Escherichia coli]|nr:hypothetical protein BvCmsKSP055_03381 [Escherichia coli]GDO84144.1 hypothetical protein BvCmsNSNP020_02672 [Escherichia coli]
MAFSDFVRDRRGVRDPEALYLIGILAIPHFPCSHHRKATYW